MREYAYAQYPDSSSYLSGPVETLPDDQVASEPGECEVAEEFPLDATDDLDAVTDLKHVVAVGKNKD